MGDIMSDREISASSLRGSTDDAGATHADVWFDDYRFRNGQRIARLLMHYATLGEAHRDAAGRIDNAILVLHWTGVDARALLTTNYTNALFAPGKPLDARRFFLIFPDNVGHGRSSKPSDGMKTAFPNYGYGDMVDLQHRLVTDVLGIERLRAVVGMSMGGMHAWLWAQAFPDAMDGIMPVVSLPMKISGRNLLWRRMVINAIRSDPAWNNGRYEEPPKGWLRAYEIHRMMTDSVPHLQSIIPDIDAAEQFLKAARAHGESADANDVLYALEASADYDPEPRLASIKAKVYALNFSDDELNPPCLNAFDRLMPLVPHGRFVTQEASGETTGHSTTAHPRLWSAHVADFMRALEDLKSTIDVGEN